VTDTKVFFSSTLNRQVQVAQIASARRTRPTYIEDIFIALFNLDKYAQKRNTFFSIQLKAGAGGYCQL
jgi:hypothetical protein